MAPTSVFEEETESKPVVVAETETVENGVEATESATPAFFELHTRICILRD